MKIDLKKYMYGNEALILFLVWFTISNVFNFTNLVFFTGIFVLLIGIFVFRYLKTSNMKKKYSSDLSYYYFSPQPITSMVDALYVENYKAKDIKKIDFIAYDLAESCNYGQKKISKIIASNKNVEINIIGHGDKEHCINSESHANNLSYFPINEKKTEHKNLIYMNDGRTFLWYEPYHKIENGEHFFKKGGYFLEPSKKVLESIEEDINNLKSQSR